MDLEIKYNEIKKLIDKGEIQKAKDELKSIISENPKEDNAYYLLGNIFRKEQNWQLAMNNYTLAIEINPSSPAQGAWKMCQEILNFYDTTMYNH